MWIIYLQSNIYWFILGYIILAILACLVLAYSLRKMLNPKRCFIFIFAINFITPAIGVVFTILYIGYLRYMGYRAHYSKTIHVAPPIFNSENALQINLVDMGQDASYDLNFKQDLSSEHKLAALIARNRIKIKQTNLINRNMLHESQDDLRLYAHGQLSKQQANLDGKISALEVLYQAKPRVIIAQMLMSFYCELITRRVSDKILYSGIIERCNYYLDFCLQHDPKNVHTNLLAAKIAKLENDTTWLEEILIEASNLSSTCDVSFDLAKLNFYKRNFDKVRAEVGLVNAKFFSPNQSAQRLFWHREGEV